jgi:Zn-dependent peptidase ImmA (M78 family)/transcriptional regulator with XRE-family HTH domain
MQQFNYHMLCLARDVRELSQAELAQRAGIAQGTLSKYETGLLLPTDEAVAQLSEALQFPKSFFYQPEQPYGFPPFHFRKRKKLSAKALTRIISEMNICRMHIKRLLVSYQRPQTGLIPEVDPDEYQGVSSRRPTIEDIARHVREAWGVPRGPINNMVELIERNGGIVVPCAFGTDLIDAMSQRIDGMPVLFFVNKTAPADRVRYTLAHELGHMVLHTLSMAEDETMEDQADAFAGAFLVPADEFRPQVRARRFDLAHLANLKGYWKVSMAALAMRADRLNMITPHQKKMFWIEMGKWDYRKNEPNEPVAESPQALARMIHFHQHVLDYSTSDIATLLHLNDADFRRLYSETVASRRGVEAPRLRLVT